MRATAFRKGTLVLVSLFILSAILFSFNQPPKNVSTNVVVEKRGKVWKVDPGIVHIQVVAGTKYYLKWKAMGSALNFWFPRKELFGQKEYTVAKGDSLELEIKSTKPGRYPYSVFVVADSSIAEGNSSPIIIIE